MRKNTLPADIKTTRVGIAAKNLSSQKTFYRNNNEVFGTASVIKIVLAIVLFQKAEKKLLDLKEMIVVKKDEVFDAGLGDCGVLKYFNNTPVSLYNICLLMLSLSDNTATNVILRFVTKHEVNTFLQTYNFNNTKLTIDKLSLSLLDDKNYVGLTTANETLEILEGIVTHQFVNKKNSDAILQMMSVQQIDHKIPRLLPSVKNFTTNADIIEIASKTGELSSAYINNDVAVITRKNGEKILMVILTQGIQSKTPNMKCACIDHPSARYIAKQAVAIYKKLVQK